MLDVPGPAVVGLPKSELLKLVTVNMDAVTEKGNVSRDKVQVTKTKPPISISTSADLKEAYPDQFDRIGNFSGKAKLILKKDTEPLIDPPCRCSIHIKDKLKAELNKLVEQDVFTKSGTTYRLVFESCIQHEKGRIPSHMLRSPKAKCQP